MKDYEEMAKSVLSRRDAYVAERKKCMKKIVSIGSCFCLALLLCVGVWHTQTGDPVSENSPSNINTGTLTGSVSGEGDQDMSMTSEELTSAMLDAGYTQAEVEEYQSIGYQITWAKWWKFFHSIEDNGGDFTLDALKTFSQEELLINTGDLSGGAYVGGSNDGDSTLDEQKMSSPKDVVNGQVSDNPGGSVANSGDLPGGAYVGDDNDGDPTSDEQKMLSKKDVINGQVSDHPGSVADSEG